MANPRKRVPEDVPGDFFVDSTCIDCDACRQIAPSVFGEAAETSFVNAQPVSSTDRRQALQALLACPTGSIGRLGDDDVKEVMKDLPLVVEESVFYCGYNSPSSYGGISYFIRLRELREHAGLTQQQLAQRAGMACRTITHLEGGDRRQTWESVLTLCGGAEVECGEFAKEPAAPLPERRRGRPTKVNTKAMQPKNPRGRPRKTGG
jgi:ferredoxin/DNA-binding XRE family transcriptional regulator